MTVTVTATATVLGLAWGGLVLVTAWARRPVPARVWLLRTPPCHLVGDEATRARGAILSARQRRLAVAAVVAAPLGVILPPAAPVALLVIWALPGHVARRRSRQRAAAVERGLPEAVDLFSLVVGAGLTVPLAVAAVGTRCSDPLGAELRRVADEVARGRRCADALDELPQRVGEVVRPLTAALVSSDRYGAPLVEGLDRLAAEVRADRRRRAEAAARRVPVKLLFPLVLCILPAFALLTVAPLLAGALRALRL